jgi:hypothetical protein
MHPAADHHVLELPRLNEMANLAIGHANARRELLRCFDALVGHFGLSPSENRL